MESGAERGGDRLVLPGCQGKLGRGNAGDGIIVRSRGRDVSA